MVMKKRIDILNSTERREGIFLDLVIYTSLVLLCITTLYPFWYLAAVSITSNDVAMAELSLIPKKISFLSYQKVFESSYIYTGFYWSILRTVLGTFLSLIACITTAYPLSKKYLPDRGFWTGLIIFTMFFSGGLIPTYLLVKNLRIIDTVWALILPGLVPTFSMLIMRNFFMTIPESLEESARIDGTRPMTILIRIILPLSMPIVATVILWTAVHHWNAWFDSMIYMQSTNKQVLQVILRRIVLEGTQEIMDMGTGIEDTEVSNPDSLKAASIMVTSLPIIVVYPFVQKYFVKGVMVGSLKG